ncbi:MAG: NUDIX domain-containing protein [Eubacteriales bacterium]|nr:NUDIX domain-containing protein [Eubacteriales bacterium]
MKNKQKESENKSIREHSAGAVVYRLKPESKELEYLLICHRAGHWSFPKGHLEAGEDSIAAAIREVKEETSIEIDLDIKFHRESRYSTLRHGPKLVDFYLGRALNPEALKYQRAELKAARWLSFEKAIERLDFARDKEILKEAREYLKTLD